MPNTCDGSLTRSKVKCDGHPPESCSRCRRMRLPCVPPTNLTTRQTKAQLQRELDILKGRLVPQGSHTDNHNISTTVSGLVTAEQIPSPALPTASTGPLGISSTQGNDGLSTEFDPKGCSHRSLDGESIESYKIRDCFNL